MSEGAGPLRVLMLEDSRFDAELLREHLLSTHPSADIHWVPDRARYAAALQAGTFDLILSDYELPGYSGQQALELAREISPQTPFVFVSGLIGEDNAVEMLKRGATDYVSKSRLSRLSPVMARALREVAERGARERAEAQLRAADAVYRRVVDSLRGYAVILLDRSGHVKSWNQAATDIFGHHRDDMPGRSASVLFTPADRAAGVFDGEMAMALAEGEATCDRWMLRADGTQLRAEGVLTPLFGDAGEHNGFCMIVHDVTAAFEDAAALRAAKEEAERASRAKDRFLAMLSHELRTPLTPIVAAAHVLTRVAEIPERFADLLPMILRNVSIESRLIDDLLDLTSITAGKLRLSRGPVDMHALIGGVVRMLDGDARSKGITVTQALRAPEFTVDGDEARLHQIVWNLVRNAIKFTPEGGRVELDTRVSSPGQFVLRCVDSGIGIPEAALPAIFAAFEQAEAGGAPRSGGLGLGLAIASGLVKEHGGTLVAESDGQDRGACFTLELPLRPAAARAVPEAAPAVALPSVSAVMPCHLLLVEDNTDAASAMHLSLEALGYRVTLAVDVASALQAAGAERFDVVVTDLGLPDASGIEVGRQLSARLPVIALSGFGQPQDLAASKAAGFRAHLVKPAGPQAVHEAVQRVLAE